MNILITICARGGSKGIPGKNIKEIGGKPLIEYTINVAKRFLKNVGNSEIAVSTDSDDIAKISRDNGLDVPYSRPSYLATDKAGKVDTIYDLLVFYENLRGKSFDYILDLDVTSPLRTIHDLMEAFNKITEDKNAINLFSVSPSSRNPYFNMVIINSDGYCQLPCKTNRKILSRQDAPRVYDLNASFYFYKREFFSLGFKSVFTPKTLIYEVKHTCFDLDHPIDFEFLSFLIEQNKLEIDLA